LNLARLGRAEKGWLLGLDAGPWPYTKKSKINPFPYWHNQDKREGIGQKKVGKNITVPEK